MKVISSKLKMGYLIIIAIASALFCLLASHFIIGFTENIPVTVLSLCFAAFGCYGFATLITAKELILTRESLKIKSAFFSEKVIAYNEIKGYIEIEKSSEHFRWKNLTILTIQGEFTISSHYFTNYKRFKSRIAKMAKKDIKAEKEWHQKQNRQVGLGFIITGVLFFTAIWCLNIREGRSLTLENGLVLFLISSSFALYGLFNLLKK